MRCYYKTLTALHAGTGTELGIVDLPIQRDSLTKFPKIEASTLKGALKTNLLSVSEDKKKIYDYLGKESNNEEHEISQIGIGDASLLLFPIALRKGNYCYITCEEIVTDIGDFFNYEKEKEDQLIKLEHYEIKGKKISVRRSVFDINKDIYCIENKIFKMLVENYTEVHTRIKIDDETGTVDEKSGPFTIEYLPRETYLYNEIFSTSNDGDTLDNFEKYIKNLKPFQIGGNKSLGKGFISIFSK